MKREVKQLIDGFDTHVRKDEKVIRVRGKGKPVAEVVVGSETVRVNFRDRPEVGDLHIGGSSKSWPGGGVQVTDENLETVKRALQAAVESATVADGATARGRHDDEVVTIPVRRRGRKMNETTVEEMITELEAAEEEGILAEVLSTDIAHLLRQRINTARERRAAQREVAA